MNLQIEKGDIKNIGHTIYEESGNTVFVCDIRTCNVEEILLRNILKCFGDEFEIIDTEDYWYELPNGEDDVDIVYFTNLPYDEYRKTYEKEGDE